VKINISRVVDLLYGIKGWLVCQVIVHTKKESLLLYGLQRSGTNAISELLKSVGSSPANYHTPMRSSLLHKHLCVVDGESYVDKRFTKYADKIKNFDNLRDMLPENTRYLVVVKKTCEFVKSYFSWCCLHGYVGVERHSLESWVVSSTLMHRTWTEFWVSAEKKYPEKVHVLFYEDLDMKALGKFIGIEPSELEEQWRNIGQREIPQSSNNRIRIELPEWAIDLLEKNCG